MIDISRLTESDVGRAVVYTDGAGGRYDGSISSWNDDYIFVHYAAGRNTAAATRPEDLEWKTRHVVDDLRSDCDCRECWYMRGFFSALARMETAGIAVPDELPAVGAGTVESIAKRFGSCGRDDEHKIAVREVLRVPRTGP